MINNNTPTRRDLMTRAFLPDNGLLRQPISRETLNGYADMLLGKGKYSRVPIPGSQNFPEIRTRVDMKKYDLASVCYRYARMFELCRVIGVRHIYDIGCQTINQAFLLSDYTAMRYTGIQNGDFFLNDWLEADMKAENYNVLETKVPPEPFCGGRIRFIHGHYPDFPLETEPDNIALASCSFTLITEEEEARRTVTELKRDFDRVLFNIATRKNDGLALWKKHDWNGWRVAPVGPNGYVFASQIPEDFIRLDKVYPRDGVRYLTGIDDSATWAFELLSANPSPEGIGWAEWNTEERI